LLPFGANGFEALRKRCHTVAASKSKLGRLKQDIADLLLVDLDHWQELFRDQW